MKSINRYFAIFSMTFSMAIMSTSAFAIKEHAHATDSKDPKIRNKALASKIWWNQKRKVEKINLSEKQRNEMDTILIDYLQDQPNEVKAEKQAFKDLATALNSEGKEKTRVQKNKLLKATSASVSRQIDMMFKVTRVLTTKQRNIINKEYPSLMSRLWIRSANPAAFRIGRGEGKRTKRKGKKNTSHVDGGHSH